MSTELNPSITERMVLNLDVGDLNSALNLVEKIGDYFTYVKVGSELYAESGAQAVDTLRDMGKKVFLDLKIHDIPNTVERSLRVHAKRGIAMATVHSAGGQEMLLAARKGLDEGSEEGGFEPPILLAVTVLTSLPPDEMAFNSRLDLINKVGCDLVCSAHEVSAVMKKTEGVRALVPGIRLAGQDSGDQIRVATPYDAIFDGATWIALGRAVYASDDPLAASAEVYDQVKAALNDRETANLPINS